MNQVPLDGFNAEDPRPCLPPQQQGQRANMTGKRAESTIYCFVKELGYRTERQYPICVGIHGATMKTDLYIHPTDKFPKGIAIESKWQEKNGSVDEKYCFLIENIRTRYKAPAIVVYGGGGARPGMIRWMRSQVDGQRILAVLSWEKFFVWANQNL